MKTITLPEDLARETLLALRDRYVGLLAEQNRLVAEGKPQILLDIVRAQKERVRAAADVLQCELNEYLF